MPIELRSFAVADIDTTATALSIVNSNDVDVNKAGADGDLNTG